MLIKQLCVDGLRNLENLNLNFNAKLNILVGPNGSGKTSLLEAIYFLAVGKSFKASKANNIIGFDKKFASILAIYSNQSASRQIKVSTIKHLKEEKHSKIGDTKANNVQIARLAPVQIIHESSSKLIFAEPDIRRKFLDWLVFYDNKDYQNLWREFTRILEQRNNLFAARNKDLMSILDPIDRVFVELAEKVAAARQNVWENFEHVWLQCFDDLDLNVQIRPQINLFKGWDGVLAEKIKNTRQIDHRFGFTSVGPHRADLRFTIQDKMAKEVLSRGQGKALSLAMILARAVFITRSRDKEDTTSILLIDDLCAELDDLNIKKVVSFLSNHKNNLQVFITDSDADKLLNIFPKDMGEWFFIKNGVVARAQEALVV